MTWLDFAILTVLNFACLGLGLAAYWLYLHFTTKDDDECECS